MSTPVQPLDRVQERQKARFERMGLPCRAMPDGRCLLVSLPMTGGPLESLAGEVALDRLLFATVGPDRIKCLRPRPVFGLPLIDIRRCADAAGIEATIRQTWRDRLRELRETGHGLQLLGVEVGSIEGGTLLAFPISGESPDHPVLMQRIDEAILPSAGPLAGQRLIGLGERVVDVSGQLESASTLDLFLGARMREVARTASAREAEERREHARIRVSPSQAPVARAASPIEPTGSDGDRPPRQRDAKVLLVGNQVLANEALREELKRNGYRLATARSEPEALMRLAAMTPDLVISQYVLGRSDGATFVQALRGLPGIVRIPVVLLDEAHHASRQDAARAVGAAGYVIQPIEADRFVRKLHKLASAPSDRRFTRFSSRLAARMTGVSRPCLVTEIGRGGLFLATSAPLGPQSAARCQITLPELRRDLTFVGEVLYRSELQGVDRQGIGLRICEMSPEDESALIAYVTLRARQS